MARIFEKALICPICGKKCASPSGLSSHLRSCKEAPPCEELESLCEAGWTIKDMQVRYSASGSTVARWLREYGLKTRRQGGRVRAEERCEIFPGYAPKRGIEWLQCAKPPDPDEPWVIVPVCAAYEECQRRIRQNLPILCEAPDREQMDELKRRKHDLLQDLTELWVEHPEYWRGDRG
jgi:hypothetical protein